MTTQELKTRKIEFLVKLKDLIIEYNVAIGINDDHSVYIVTDGHESESWNAETCIKDIDDEYIDDALNSLEQ